MEKEIQTVNIVGMGALGLLYGNMIADHLGAEHVTYVMDTPRYERHRSDEYRINGERVRFSVVRAEDARPCGLLIVAVKYTQLEEALETMRTSIGEDTIIISVMNGITTEEIIGERYGMDRVIYTVAQGMDAMRFGTELTFTKSGQLHVGADVPAKQEKLDRVTAFFDRAGIAYIVEQEIKYRVWSKFMINVGLNQTCMVCGANYAGVTAPNSLPYMIMVSAMREVMLLSRAEGVNLTEEDLKFYLSLLKTFSPEATPSMGQDRINKRPSEVELFAGTVIRLAKKHGILVPTNEFLYRRVHEIEAGYGEEPCESASRLQQAGAAIASVQKLHEDKKWTTEELGKALEMAGVPRHRYNLSGQGRTDERLCLKHQQGKWTVDFVERGVRTTCEVFDTEDQACRFLYKQLLGEEEQEDESLRLDPPAFDKTSTVEKIIKDVREKYPALYTSFHFGAIHLAPQHLVVCFIFKSDHELNQAARNGTCESIERYWKESMLKNGWPEEAFSVKELGHTATCVFASQETCDREFNGNWWYYFK